MDETESYFNRDLKVDKSKLKYALNKYMKDIPASKGYYTAKPIESVDTELSPSTAFSILPVGDLEANESEIVVSPVNSREPSIQKLIKNLKE